MLKQLSEQEFERRTAGGARTPVFKEFIADRETPVSVLTRVAETDASVFLLESVAGGAARGRYSYLGLDPERLVTEDAGADPLPALRAAVQGRPFTPAPELPSLQGGAIGYFPSYAFGSAYGAQFLKKMKETVDVDRCVAEGNFAPINDWNREHIWQYGSLYTPAELLDRVLGEPCDPMVYVEYLENKAKDVYGI